MNSKVIISIEGNIGVGKSSFIEMLKKVFKTRVEYISEPVDEWISIKDTEGKNILETFYTDKKRWGYTFQNIAYITRMNRLVNAIKNTSSKYIILDRSLDADFNTFAKMLYDSGEMTEIEWNAYNLWNSFYYQQFGQYHSHHVIYLQCDPQTAYDRIHHLRCRDEEKGIPLDYLQSLHKYHEDWLRGDKENVLVLDVDKDFVNDSNYFDVLLDQFMGFIAKI